jgi:hypothetical protein
MRAWACSTRLVGVDQEGEAPPGGGRRGAAAAMICGERCRQHREKEETRREEENHGVQEVRNLTLRLEVGSVWPEVHCARRN